MVSARFTSLDTYDVRFPTSRDRDGSDAMNPDPDYSAAYVILRTDDSGGREGHGFAHYVAVALRAPGFSSAMHAGSVATGASVR